MFEAEWPEGTSYEVAISSQPADQSCSVTNSSGQLINVDITNVQVICDLRVPSLTVSTEGIKTLHFNWDDVSATYYRLLKNSDGISGYTQVGENLASNSASEMIAVHLTDWNNVTYIVQACLSEDRCSESEPVSVSDLMLEQIGYFKASDLESSEGYGARVTLSGDGNTMAIASPHTNSPVYIYVRDVDGWRQQDRLIRGEGYAQFESDIALSEDGATLVIGVSNQYTRALPVGAAQQPTGAVYVYQRIDDNWEMVSYLVASNRDSQDYFGQSLALSSAGDVLAVGAVFEDSRLQEVYSQDNNSLSNSGAVYLYTRKAEVWEQTALLKASNADIYDRFGSQLALSAEGSVLVVSSMGEDSTASGVNGDQQDESLQYAGAVYLY